MSETVQNDSTTTRELLRTNLFEVFGNRDAQARRAAIEATYAEDVVFTDPDGPVTGWDALEQRVVGLLSTVPEEVEFGEDGLAYADARTGALAWRLGSADAPLARGIDIITVRDGRIAELHTIVEQA